MRRAVGGFVVAALVVLGLVVIAFWPTGEVDTPAAAEKKHRTRVESQSPSGRTVYHFERAPPAPAPPPEETRSSLTRAEMNAFAESSNLATGLMWDECMRPWRDEHELPDAPLTINLVLDDGRVGDVELISPVVLDAALIQCMEDELWSVPFPELPDHQGELRLQRTLNLRR